MAGPNHRERVLMAINHQEPDRIPLDMMGNACMLLDPTYLRLRDYLGLAPIPPVRSGTSANYYDERILEYFDIDFRRIFLPEKKTPVDSAQGEDEFTDSWGIPCKKDGLYINTLQSPLQHIKTVEDIDAYPWPQAQDLFSTDGLESLAKEMFHHTDYALVARNPLSRGLLDRACQLMGMPEFLMAMVATPELAHHLIARLLEIYKQIYGIFLDKIGPYVQVVETADDLGTQQNLLISPDLYRTFLKPADRELNSFIRENAPHAAIFRHTDGSVFEVIPDLIDAHVDILNPVQTSTRGMDPEQLKAAYGDRITFHGSIEKTGDTVDALVNEVRERIKFFAPRGGFILASCNHMIDVPPENIIAMFEVAHRKGKYSAMRNRQQE